MVDVARGVHVYAPGLAELRRRRRPPVAAEPSGPGAGDRRNVPRSGIDLADSVVFPIADVEVARGVHRHPAGLVQLRRGGRPAITAEARRAAGKRLDDRPGQQAAGRADEGGDVPGSGVDLADTVVVRVGDVDVAGAVHRHPVGTVEPRRRRQAAVSREAGHPRGASKDGNASPTANPADDAVI